MSRVRFYKKITDRVQQQYLELIRRAATALRFPDTWPVNLVTHVPKPGKSVTHVAKMRGPVELRGRRGCS